MNFELNYCEGHERGRSRQQKKMIPCSLMLEGEYGQNDICLGVPAIIEANGVESIVNVTLTAEEQLKFAEAANAVREVNGDLKF